jgi:MYXO-CTERM domain-containing protein
MPGLGKTGTVRGSARGSPARSQEIYQRYAVVLYRQALLNLDDPAPAGQVACDVLVNERALAAMPERDDDDDARYRLGESVFRRFRQLAAGPAQQDRRPGQGALGLLLFGGLGYIRRKRRAGDPSA